ncbi:unnamed protein product [Lampetra planeri]
MELQEAAPELAWEAHTSFLQRERMEDKTPYAFRAALLALGREAYPLLGEGVAERLRELARKLWVALPSAVGMEISHSTVTWKIQVFEEKQQRASWEAVAWSMENMMAAVGGQGMQTGGSLREDTRWGQLPLPCGPTPRCCMCGQLGHIAAECRGDE